MKSSILFSCSLVSLLVSSTWAQPVPTFRTVAVTGQQAPGISESAAFTYLYMPTINNAGQVAFSGRLAFQPDGSINNFNDTGLWSEGTGTLELLVREGEPASGVSTSATYNDFDQTIPNIGDSGAAVWSRPYRVDGVQTSAIWTGKAGDVNLVASSGSQAAGLPSGVNFLGFNPPLINAQGDVAFISSLAGSGVSSANNNNLAVWSTTGGNLSPIVRLGDHAPGTPPDTNFLSLTNLRLNAAGEIAFLANLTEIQVLTQFQSGIWSTDSGELSVVARDFDPAPGTLPGGEFDINTTLSTPSFNAAGQVAFLANLQTLAEAGIDNSNNTGIWSSGSGNIALVARKGDQAPGVPAGAKFTFFASNPRLSDSGHTTFLAQLEIAPDLGIVANNSVGVWSDASGSLELLLREGDQAPGMPAGMGFSGFRGRVPFQFTTNAAGHIAFATQVFNGATSAHSAGLWAQDPNGTLRLVVHQGELFEVAPGDERTINYIDLLASSAGGDGLNRTFNDNYQLAMRLSFTDGSSGIFIAQLAIPEPNGVAIAALGAVGFFTRRKRHG